MTFLHFVRRAHLYAGLFLLPWVVMFGVSTIPLNHNEAASRPAWTRLGELPYDADVPPAGGNLRPLGRDIMNAAGMTGGYYVYRVNARQINVTRPGFLAPVRMIYDIDARRVTVERQIFAWRPFLSGLHMRGGYDLDGFWDSVWALFVDVVSLGLLLWIASGIYMWWHLPSTRAWGWLALGAGAACFAVIIATL